MNGYGFWTNDGFFLKRCYDCFRENWAMAVSSGKCASCGSTKRPLDEGAKFTGKGGGTVVWTVVEYYHDPIHYLATDGKEERIFYPDQIEPVTEDANVK